MTADELAETMDWADPKQLRGLIRLSVKQRTWNDDSADAFVTMAQDAGVKLQDAIKILDEELST